MFVYISIIFFIIGIIFGSFYNVVGYRVPKGESLLYPSSHCTKCNHKLKPLELIPIFSFLILGGKCSKCKQKISWFYPIFEFLSGMLFMLSFIMFGLTFNCLLSILFVSMLLIIIVSDYQTMIIPDEVLIVFSVLILTVKYIIGSFNLVGISLLNGLGSFIFMFLLKLLGDFIFKKESMGGGDIKLLGVYGIVLGFPLSIVSVFLAAIIGLPISLIFLKVKKSHEIPFGPFLAVSALILWFSKLDFNALINFLTN